MARWNVALLCVPYPADLVRVTFLFMILLRKCVATAVSSEGTFHVKIGRPNRCQRQRPRRVLGRVAEDQGEGPRRLRKTRQCVQDAEEIFSQTRLAACKNFAKFSGRSTFYTWAMGIARHNVAHLLKARIKRRKREQPLGDIVDSLVERHQSRRPFAADVVARLITLVPRAADASHLTASEASVLVARLVSRTPAGLTSPGLFTAPKLGAGRRLNVQ